MVGHLVKADADERSSMRGLDSQRLALLIAVLGRKAGINLASQRIALSSYAYLERIAVQEYIGGGTEQDAAKLKEAEAKIKAEGAAMAREASAYSVSGPSSIRTQRPSPSTTPTRVSPPSSTSWISRMSCLPS